ncbi:MAG: LamG-like jellyroll fold domain-containing protein [Flavobacteriales bacterium]
MKTLLTLSLAVLATVTSSAQNNIDSGLVAHFSFSGNANNKMSMTNGVISGATLTTDRFNNPKSAYSFNGSSYIDLQDAYDNAERTVSFWFNAQVVETTARVIYASDFAAVKNGLTVVNVMKVGGVEKVTLAIGYQRAEAPITTNEWHHVLMLTGNGGTKIYLDCFELSQTTSGLNHSVDGLSKTIIGASRHSSNNYFKGSIDDVRIYDRALSPQESKILCSEENPCNNFIAIQPTDATAQGGGSASFWTVSKEKIVNYQWQVNDGNGFINVPSNCFYGADNANDCKVLVAALYMNKDAFRCIVSNDQCSDTTDTVVLNIDSTTTKYDTVQVNDTIHITVYDTIHANTSDTLVLQLKTGIPQIDQLQLKLYPNPANDHLNIDFGAFQMLNGYTLSIYNAQSQQVYNAFITQQSLSLDLSAWTGAGIYLVNIVDSNGNTVATKQIVLK